MSKFEIPFITECIRAFSERFALTRQRAYDYLRHYKGLSFLIDFYDVEHLQSIDETVDDLILICKKNGGQIVKKELTHHDTAEFIINHIISELTTYLMEDRGCSVTEAMDIVYASHLLQLLQKEDEELYVQSPAYLYQLLLKEFSEKDLQIA